MTEIRITKKISQEMNHDCDKIHIDTYTLQEVILPAARKRELRKAISIIVKGRNFRAVAQPLFVRVGKTPVRFLRIAPDERSVEGILLEEPEENSYVDVILGDEDHARHPKVFKRAMVKRIK